MSGNKVIYEKKRKKGRICMKRTGKTESGYTVISVATLTEAQHLVFHQIAASTELPLGYGLRYITTVIVSIFLQQLVRKVFYEVLLLVGVPDVTETCSPRTWNSEVGICRGRL